MSATDTLDDIEARVTETEARIARGIALLDAETPDWRASINLTRLDLSDTRECPLGQVYGGWNRALDILWPDHTYREQVTLATTHGFETDEEGYAALTEAWVAALTEEQE